MEILLDVANISRSDYDEFLDKYAERPNLYLKSHYNMDCDILNIMRTLSDRHDPFVVTIA